MKYCGFTAQRTVNIWILSVVGSYDFSHNGKNSLSVHMFFFWIIPVNSPDKNSVPFPTVLSPLFFHFSSDSPFQFILQSMWKLEAIEHS